MPSYEEMVRDSLEGRIAADRMALGLASIPDEFRGDMHEVERLRAERDELKNAVNELSATIRDNASKPSPVGPK